MNTLDFLKNGSGIHIKKKNRGKFTSYCGGKVTDECIQKGKNSSNPAIRKRATFADNARHFKHKSEGIVKAQDGTKTNFFTKTYNWFSNNKDLVSNIGLIGTQLFSNIKSSKKASDYIDRDSQRIRAGKEAILSDIDVTDEAINQLNLLQLLNPDVHHGTIDLLLILKRLYQQARKKKMSEAEAWEQELIDKQKEYVDAIQGNGKADFSGFISNGMSTLSLYLGNPKVTSEATSKVTPTTFSTPTTDLGNGFSYNLNTGMTYKPNWNSMLKYLFGGKYFLPSVKTAYGYPVYWSDEVPSRYKWAKEYLKNHPDVTGFAVGGGAQGDDEDDPRVIIRNVHSNIITDRNDKRWDGLDEIEAIRHFMNETNYHPNFKISPEQETFRRTNFSEDAPYNTNDDAWRQSIISRILVGDMKGTPEQIKEADNFYEKFRKQKGHGYW